MHTANIILCILFNSHLYLSFDALHSKLHPGHKEQSQAPCHFKLFCLAGIKIGTGSVDNMDDCPCGSKTIWACRLVWTYAYLCELPPLLYCHSHNEKLPALELIPLGEKAVQREKVGRHNEVGWRKESFSRNKKKRSRLEWSSFFCLFFLIISFS